MRYEVVKVSNNYIYLAHFSGTASNIVFLNKKNKQDKAKFVKSCDDAWRILFQNDVLKAQEKLKSCKKLLSQHLKKSRK